MGFLFIWNPIIAIIAAIIGMILGAWADAYPWIRYVFYQEDRWALYGKYHHERTWLFYTPPGFLHYMVDLPMHKPDGKWWPRDWELAFLWWSVELLGLAIFLIILI